MILSDDIEKFPNGFLASQAREPVLHYEHKELGYNYVTMCYRIGIGQLSKIEKITKKEENL